MNLLERTLVTLVILLTGCQDLWAQNIGAKIARDLNKIQSYEAIYHEAGVLPEETVVRKIQFGKPWSTRVEVLKPAAYAGELFIFDGTTIKMWWPKAGFGIEVAGVTTPTYKQVKKHIQRLTRKNLAVYGFSLRPGSPRIAGESTKKWRVVPLRRMPYRLVHDSYMHSKYSVPMKISFKDGKGVWYGMAFDEITFNKPLPVDTFDFEFPKNAVVFRWDLSAPASTLQDARERMNFTVREPKTYPKGHKLQKVVVPKHCLPMMAMLANRGATWLSVTQSRHMPGLFKPLGKPVMVGKNQGYLSFLGGFTTVNWVVGNTFLTLTTNLAFPEALSFAASFE